MNKEKKVDLNRVHQVINCLNLQARMFILVSGYEEVMLNNKDIGCVALSMLEMADKLEKAVGEV